MAYATETALGVLILGRNVGLIAVAALLIDYTLTAAVSLMAGSQALSGDYSRVFSVVRYYLA